MAEAIIRGVLNQKNISASDFLISELVESRRKFLKDTYKINVTNSNSSLIEKSDVIILCVKPQNLFNVGEELKGLLKPDQLLISILAGISINKLIDQFDHERVIRVMPNTPAQIGEGASVWLAAEDVSVDDKSFAKNMSPGFTVSNSPLPNSNSTVPVSVMTYCFRGAGCQSYVPPGSVSANRTLWHSMFSLTKVP